MQTSQTLFWFRFLCKILYSGDAEIHSEISNVVENILIQTSNISGPVGIQRLVIQP